MSAVNIDISSLQRLNLPDSLLLPFSMLLYFDKQRNKDIFFVFSTVPLDH